MRIRLNMWQRAGIVASVVWPVVYYFVEMNRQTAGIADIAYGPCVRAMNTDINCGRAMYDSLWNEAMWTSILAATVPVPFAWLFAYVVIWTARWVWAGRKAREPT